MHDSLLQSGIYTISNVQTRMMVALGDGNDLSDIVQSSGGEDGLRRKVSVQRSICVLCLQRCTTVDYHSLAERAICHHESSIPFNCCEYTQTKGWRRDLQSQ